jgi:hypothetical protein
MPGPLDAMGALLGTGWRDDLLPPVLALILGWLLLGIYARSRDRRYPRPSRSDRRATGAEASRRGH